MSRSPDHFAELLRLLDAMREGQLTPEQGERLDRWVIEDGDACQTVVEYLDLCATLEWRHAPVDWQLPGGHAAPPSNRMPIIDMPPLAIDKPAGHRAGATWLSMVRPREIWLDAAPIVIFGCLMLAVGILAGWPIFSARDADRFVDNARIDVSHGVERPGQQRAPRSIATLVAVHDCEWADAPAPMRVGATIAAERPLRLAKGVAELLLVSGVRTVVAGPAAIVLREGNSLALETGSVWAQVPAEAIGFRVVTPMATVIDLGTEFGVRVDPAKVVEVHVFRGVVALEPLAEQGRASARLEAGHARRLPSTEPVSWTEVGMAPALFHRDVSTPLTESDAPPEPPTLQSRERAAGWTPVVSDTFDSPRLNDDAWEILPRGSAAHSTRQPAVTPKSDAMELANGGVLMTSQDFAPTDSSPIRVAVEAQVIHPQDIPTLYLDACPADDPSDPQFMTHGAKCMLNAIDPQSGRPALAILFGYPGQQRLELKFAACPAVEKAGRYRLAAVLSMDRVTFQVTKLDHATWTRVVECDVPKGFVPGAKRRVAFGNNDQLPNDNIALLLHEAVVSRREAPAQSK